MNKDEFEKLVLEAIKEIPVKFRHRMENVEITVEDRPSQEILEKQGIAQGSLLLGLYQGVPITKRTTYYTNVLPDKITIYQENVEKITSGEKNLKETIKRVIIHEIGHYYGLGEEDMK